MTHKRILYLTLSGWMLTSMLGCSNEIQSSGSSIPTQVEQKTDTFTETGQKTDTAVNAEQTTDAPVETNQTTADDLPQTATNDSTETAQNADEPEVNTDTAIDVDLTQLSSTMVYSEVYNMMVTPSDYIGKTVKMSGTVTKYHDDTDNKDYYACIIQDATACCAQGIEFELPDNESYPEVDTEITVTGRFDTYTIESYEFCTLRNAVIEYN